MFPFSYPSQKYFAIQSAKWKQTKAITLSPYPMTAVERNTQSSQVPVPWGHLLPSLQHWAITLATVQPISAQQQSSLPFHYWQKYVRSSLVPIILINNTHLSKLRRNARRIHLACKLYGVLVTQVMKLDRLASLTLLHRQNRFIHNIVLYKKAIASCRGV